LGGLGTNPPPATTHALGSAWATRGYASVAGGSWAVHQIIVGRGGDETQTSAVLRRCHFIVATVALQGARYPIKFRIPNFGIPNFGILRLFIPRFGIPKHRIPKFRVPKFGVLKVGVLEYSISFAAIRASKRCIDALVSPWHRLSGLTGLHLFHKLWKSKLRSPRAWNPKVQFSRSVYSSEIGSSKTTQHFVKSDSLQQTTRAKLRNTLLSRPLFKRGPSKTTQHFNESFSLQKRTRTKLRNTLLSTFLFEKGRSKSTQHSVKPVSLQKGPEQKYATLC